MGERYDGGEDFSRNRRKEDGRFSINTTFNIANLLAIIALVFAMFAGITDVKTTIATNIADLANLKAERLRDATELRASMQVIDAKVTRLLERRTGDGQ